MSKVKPGFIIGTISLLFALALMGCRACKPGQPGPTGRYTIEVSLVDSLLTNSVIVDLVGVSQSGLAGWNAYDLDKYWDPQEDEKRRDANKRTLSFVSGTSRQQKVTARDGIWDDWKSKGVRYVFVLADLYLSAQDKGHAGEDPRRMVLDLDECKWPPNTKTLRVLIKAKEIEVQTGEREVR